MIFVLYHLAGDLSRPCLGAESLTNRGVTGEHLEFVASVIGPQLCGDNLLNLFYPNTGEDKPKTLCTSTHLNLARGAVPV